jgi:hypothetical protein
VHPRTLCDALAVTADRMICAGVAWRAAEQVCSCVASRVLESLPAHASAFYMQPL